MDTQECLDHITQYLTMVSDMRGGRGPEKFVLDHGIACGPRVDVGLPLMKAKQCYYNSYTTLTFGYVNPNEWFYCEGYAVRASLMLPMSHAWLVNNAGEVLDRTWREDDDSDDVYGYFGVPFRRTYLVKNSLKTGYPSPIWANEMFNMELEDMNPAQFKQKLNPGALDKASVVC